MLDKLWRKRIERVRYAAVHPAASTGTPTRKTGSSFGSWKLARKPRWPKRPSWKRTTSDSPKKADHPHPLRSARRFRPWPGPVRVT
jgi:hypothetical protein